MVIEDVPNAKEPLEMKKVHDSDETLLAPKSFFEETLTELEIWSETVDEINSLKDRAFEEIKGLRQRRSEKLEAGFTAASDSWRDPSKTTLLVTEGFNDSIQTEFQGYHSSTLKITRSYVAKTLEAASNLDNQIKSTYEVFVNGTVEEIPQKWEGILYICMSIVFLWLVMLGVYPSYHIASFKYLLSRSLVLHPYTLLVCFFALFGSLVSEFAHELKNNFIVIYKG